MACAAVYAGIALSAARVLAHYNAGTATSGTIGNGDNPAGAIGDGGVAGGTTGNGSTYLP